MKQLDFTYASAQNFLCYGPEGIELDLKKYGNVVLVRGNNLDVNDEEERVASNGVGKSSIPEIIVYTLFGKTIKHPKKLSHRDVINNQIGKGLRTEVRWGNYRVVRTRKPDSLRLWESEEGIWDDEHEITLGGMPATQEEIERKLGLNYETFVNVVIFTDNNAGSFLECDTPTKREIVENLLSLDKYRNFTDTAKGLRNKAKERISTISKEYEGLLAQHKACEDRIAKVDQQEKQWYATKQAELDQLARQITAKQKELEQSDEGAALAKWQNAQSRLVELNSQLDEAEKKKAALDELLRQAQDKLNAAKTTQHEKELILREAEAKRSAAEQTVTANQRRIDELESKKNAECQFCFGEVSEANYGSYVEKLRTNINEQQAIIKEQSLIQEVTFLEFDAARTRVKKISDSIVVGKNNAATLLNNITGYRNEINQLNRIEKPKTEDLQAKILEKQLESLLEQSVNKKAEIEGKSPFEEIRRSANEELVNKEQEVKTKRAELSEAEKQLPYYEFWVTAFGDAGIRKFVIDGIIPALNSRIAYWLQFLIDGKIKLEFDNQLEETISRNPSDGDPFVYHAMSGGERRRLNLAVSQAFAHVMMLNSGRAPSVVFLDEVTTNIDPIGVVGVYNMIMELAKERQVFITTHDQGLLDLLQGCETVNLEKKKGFTTLV